MPLKDHEENLEYMRNYHSQHREERKRKGREYYQKHKEERKKYDKEYFEGHHEQRKLYNRKIRKEVKDFLVQKHGKICFCCKKEPKGSYLVFHEKHFLPHEHLTPNQIRKLWENFIPLCRNCHRTLHYYRKYKEEFEKLLIQSPQ